MTKLRTAVSEEEIKQFFGEYLKFKKYLGSFFLKICKNVMDHGGSFESATVICYRLVCWMFRDLSLSLERAEVTSLLKAFSSKNERG